MKQCLFQSAKKTLKRMYKALQQSCAYQFLLLKITFKKLKENFMLFTFDSHIRKETQNRKLFKIIY